MNITATTAAEGFPRRSFTDDDIRRMIDAGVIGEDEKFELIEGEIFRLKVRAPTNADAGGPYPACAGASVSRSHAHVDACEVHRAGRLVRDCANDVRRAGAGGSVTAARERAHVRDVRSHAARPQLPSTNLRQ